MKIRIRLATVADLSTLVRHRRAMFAEMGEKDERDMARHDRVYRQWARVRLRRGELVGFVAEVNGKTAGSGCVWLQERQPRPGLDHPCVPYLLSMFTEPDFRGCGIATRIVKAAHDWCRKHGHGNISLHASKMGRSIYKKLGYARTWEMRLRL
jgi:GNAT superfamily N-acetyltransferase